MTSTVADELASIIRVAEPEFRALTEDFLRMRPAPDRWTIKEVLGHLIDSAANNHQRFIRAQFAPMTGLIFPEYEQVEWVRCQNYNEANWTGLIDLWTAYNRHLLHVIRFISNNDQAVSCLIGDNPPVTLQFLIEDYVVHLKHHLRKIAERLNVNPQRFGA